MGGGAFDVYRVCERMAAHRPRRRDVGARHVPRQRPDPGRRDARSRSASWHEPDRRGGRPVRLRRHRARGGQRPRRAEDDRRAGQSTNGAVTGYRISGGKQWISNGGVADVYTILANAPGGPTLVRRRARRRRGSRTASPRTSTASALSNTAGAVPRQGRTSPADRLVGGVEGQGLVQAQQVFGYTRLMVAAFGLGAGWAALDRAIPYSAERIQAGGPLSREAGLHAQADRAPRRRGSRRRGRTSRRPPSGSTRARAALEHRGRDRQVPRDRGGQRRGRRRDPGPRRLRLHARVHGREDQARRSHHHDLRGDLGDHGDDHRARPLAAAPEDRRRLLPRRAARELEALHAAAPATSAPTSPRSRSTPWPSCSSAAASAGSPVTSTCCCASAS